MRQGDFIRLNPGVGGDQADAGMPLAEQEVDGRGRLLHVGFVPAVGGDKDRFAGLEVKGFDLAVLFELGLIGPLQQQRQAWKMHGKRQQRRGG